MKYFDELKRSMEYLSQNQKVIFLGQAVEYDGTAMTNTLKNIERNKLFEMPVAEELQMGVSIGLSLNGFIPVSIYPRWNFLLLATNQLINHLDKIESLSDGGYKPKVIIRTSIGSERPLNPQNQHIGDFTDAFKLMCKNIDIIRLDNTEDIFNSYVFALNNNRSTLLIEYGDYYNEK